MRFSRVLSLLRWKWPRHNRMEQPIAAVEVWMVVRSQGKANCWWEATDVSLDAFSIDFRTVHDEVERGVFPQSCHVHTLPRIALLKSVRPRLSPK